MSEPRDLTGNWRPWHAPDEQTPVFKAERPIMQFDIEDQEYTTDWTTVWLLDILYPWTGRVDLDTGSFVGHVDVSCAKDPDELG